MQDLDEEIIKGQKKLELTEPCHILGWEDPV